MAKTRLHGVTKFVSLQSNVYVPTAFSPNKDGLNETFHPVSVAVKDYKLTVFNRWGEQIFVTQNQEEGWDGTYKNVNHSQGFICIWLISQIVKANSIEKSGTVQLMR